MCLAYSPYWSVFSEEAEEEVKLSALSASLSWEGVAGMWRAGTKGVSGEGTNSWESISPPTESGEEPLAGREKESCKHWILRQLTEECIALWGDSECGGGALRVGVLKTCTQA